MESKPKIDLSDKIQLKSNNSQINETLPAIFLKTHEIIETLITNDKKRIAFVMPIDSFDIMPLVVAKYCFNINNASNYTGNLLAELHPKQHLRLGRAVVEFQSYDATNNRININVGRTNPTQVNLPINIFCSFLEKTNGSLTSWDLYIQEKERFNSFSIENPTENLRIKRASLHKTIIVLNNSKAYKAFIENIKLFDKDTLDLLSFGEIDKNNLTIETSTKGKLTGLPSITRCSNIELLNNFLDENQNNQIIDSVFVSTDKIEDVFNNSSSLLELMKSQLPIIIFVPEDQLQEFASLEQLFSICYWSPSILRNFDLNSPLVQSDYSLFNNINRKITFASNSNLKLIISNSYHTTACLNKIYSLSQHVNSYDSEQQVLVRKIWNFFNKYCSLACNVEDFLITDFNSSLNEIEQLWNKLSPKYQNQKFSVLLNETLSIFKLWIQIGKVSKFEALLKYLNEYVSPFQSILLLIPDQYIYEGKTKSSISLSISKKINLVVQKVSYFLDEERNGSNHYDHVICISFNRNQYVNIRKTYCYSNLIYILYDFENRWRESYVAAENFLQYENRTMDLFLTSNILSPTDKECHTFDIVSPIFVLNDENACDPDIKESNSSDNDCFKEIGDYKIPHFILRSTIRQNNETGLSKQNMECIPILLSSNKIGYFIPSHDLVEISSLLKETDGQPLKIPASALKPGHTILVRQSNKDIIKETADELMALSDKSNYRKEVEKWRTLLDFICSKQSYTFAIKALESCGISCTLQQLKLWLYGDTIMPRKKQFLIAVGKIVKSISPTHPLLDDYLNSIDNIYGMGKEVQSFHQVAGKKLTTELKEKANEIRSIFYNPFHSGKIDGIGDIIIYTVEDVLEKEEISYSRCNRIEDL